MANKSKKELKRARREKYKEIFGFYPQPKFSANNGVGKTEKISRKTGKITNQKGAFGKPKWTIGLEPGVHKTFSMSNHERHKARRARAEAMKRIKNKTQETPFAKEL